MAVFRLKFLVLIIALSAACSTLAIAQDPTAPTPAPTATPPAPTATPDDTPIKVDTVLLNIPVIVSDQAGRNMPGLLKKDFIVTQDGDRQRIEFFADERAPMNVAIIVDLSGSTADVLGKIKKSAREFVDVLRPEDRAMLVGFAGSTNVLCELTGDQKKLKKAIGDVDISRAPGSVMQDAVYQVVTKEFAGVNGRKAIIVLTDGDVAGRVKNQTLLDTLTDSDVLVYPIFFMTRPLFPPGVKSVTVDQIKRTQPAQLLNLLAMSSGGRFYAAQANDFKGAFQAIADELKYQYLIGIYPDDVPAGSQPNIGVAVDRPNSFVRTKLTIRAKKTDPTQ